MWFFSTFVNHSSWLLSSDFPILYSFSAAYILHYVSSLYHGLLILDASAHVCLRSFRPPFWTQEKGSFTEISSSLFLIIVFTRNSHVLFRDISKCSWCASVWCFRHSKYYYIVAHLNKSKYVQVQVRNQEIITIPTRAKLNIAHKNQALIWQLQWNCAWSTQQLPYGDPYGLYLKKINIYMS